MTLTIDALREAMRDNYAQPEGPARNARAERLLAEAEGIGEPLAVIEALGHQLQVYNYSSEKAKMFVPFARLLRMWDERPEDFDAYETHALHWVFKWVSSGMLDQPHIPLAAIEKWLGEMEHRYRLAGHSERAVRQGEFRVARHLGDLERAERAYAAWLAADRDDMADCHACELHGQGVWQAQLGADEKALEIWAPVLEGEHTCAHEPHAVHASSLLPLVRLGEGDRARAHHLRGYRLVRPMESMRGAAALHIEFCALTGNEARGLEILAERPAYFTDSGDPDSQMDFLSVAALLMDRLVALGHGEREVPGPAGTRWTAGALARHARGEALAIAARFDERNGTDRVSALVGERMAQEPLMERLPLGVRAVGAVRAGAPVPASPASASSGEPAGVEELLAEARRLTAARHPDARGAWARLGRAVAADGPDGLDHVDGLARAELDDHAAMAHDGEPAEAIALFHDAARQYEAAGEPARAAAALARAALLHALDDRPDEALRGVEQAVARLLTLHAEGLAAPREVSGGLLNQARIRMALLEGADDGTVEEALTALEEFAAPHGDDAAVTDRAAEASSLRGDLAARSGDLAGAVGHYARAAEIFHAAGLPWYAVEAEARLAGAARHLGDLETAERAARAALEHGGPYVQARWHARLHQQLAEVLAQTGEFGQATDHALEAAHWADEAGESGHFGAYARHQLGGWLLRMGSTAEAAAILEAVLPDLTVDEHGDGMVVQTLWWLGECLMALDEPRAAAEHWLRAADLAAAWPEQWDHATLAGLAGRALYRAELLPEAERAYGRAAKLWRELGDVHALVRTLRIRGWVAGGAAGRELMAEAAGECEAALSEASGEAADRLRAELADTYRQTGELLARAEDPDLREALAWVDRAATTFASAGPAYTDQSTGADLLAAWLLLDLADPSSAAARAGAVRERYESAEGETAESRRSEADSILREARSL
ncbi:hypothetical protein [Streptomyces purpureus]|uniref:hypothetical protein n=1 Tax=Streptomyces purpureus TaxID=1951 RepID=UPI00035E250C|nr:hypothetical protein [Streptomyces purpureus]